MRSFQTLTTLMEQSVSTIGLDATIQLFDQLVRHHESLKTVPKVRSLRDIKDLSNYLKIRIGTQFDIDAEELFTKRSPDYVDARSIFFHLMYNYSDATCQDLAAITGVGKRSVWYQVRQCTSRLEFAQANSKFNSRYKGFEKSTIAFIRSLFI